MNHQHEAASPTMNKSPEFNPSSPASTIYADALDASIRSDHAQGNCNYDVIDFPVKSYRAESIHHDDFADNLSYRSDHAHNCQEILEKGEYSRCSLSRDSSVRTDDVEYERKGRGESNDISIRTDHEGFLLKQDTIFRRSDRTEYYTNSFCSSIEPPRSIEHDHSYDDISTASSCSAADSDDESDDSSDQYTSNDLDIYSNGGIETETSCSYYESAQSEVYSTSSMDPSQESDGCESVECDEVDFPPGHITTLEEMEEFQSKRKSTKFPSHNQDAASSINSSVIPTYFFCPITKTIMTDPVMTPDGKTYERLAVLRYLTLFETDPLTGNPLSYEELVEDEMVKGRIQKCRRDAWMRYAIMMNQNVDEEVEEGMMVRRHAVASRFVMF